MYDQTIKFAVSLAIEDHQITMQQIADTLSISTDTVHVSSTWVPHLLIRDQRHDPVQACQELLTHCAIEGYDFLFQIVTGDESWMYLYQPESKYSSK